MSPVPGAIATKPGSATLPFLGIKPVLLEPHTGKVLEGPNQEGALCFESSWPSMARTLKGAHQKFLKTYLHVYPGYYSTSDGAMRDEDGYYWIKGRMDGKLCCLISGCHAVLTDDMQIDVLNVSGHRLSTAELESALTSFPGCSESAVIGVHDDITGQAIVCFVCISSTVTTSPPETVKSLVQTVRTTIGPFASPKHILLVTDLPKTRSGKVVRRVLRKLWAHEDTGDTSTLADISVLEGLRNVIATAQGGGQN